jgi:hypothetical protein
MCTSYPDEVTSAADGQSVIERGLVVVHRVGIGYSYAMCSCGWSGSRRRLKAAACQDAWAHAAENRCNVAYPMVVSLIRFR